MKKQLLKLKFLVLAIITFFSFAAISNAQTTTFTYQGRLNDTTVASPTNGTYEMQFKLFNTGVVGTGMQIGDAQTVQSVSVVNGIFTVQLDAENSFNSGADLYIEISVRPAGSQAAATTLSPRQQVTSVPYSIKSRTALTATNSDNLGNLPATSYTQNTDARLSDDRNPTAGSANYVQNQSATTQASANFNISGTGKADAFDAATQYNIGGNRVLSVKGNANVFAGVNAGTANTGGNSNTFVGNFSGNANINGFNNAFFGTDAGRNNQGHSNSFFGRSSGFDTNSGSSNSFFGLDSGRFNQSGNNNAFFGRIAGNVSNADNNSFFGFYSGGFTTTGGNNAFFGFNTGLNNTIGTNNTLIGSGANVGANNLNFATAIGAGAVVSTSNTVVLGTSSTSTEIPGTLKVFTLGATGATTLCRNASNQIADCAAGTGNFINNSTVQQANAFFNISGGGTLGGTLSANLVNSVTNYRIGGSIVLATPNATSVVVGPLSNYNLTAGNNAFFGYKAGAAADNTGQGNVFFGSEAGTTNSNGAGNSFVGRDAGFTNSSGSANSFFGNSAGKQNTTASFNCFFGTGSGNSNMTGERNSFFGFQSGQSSKIVNDNSFFGYQAGKTTTGGGNSFFGSSAGISNTTGSENTFIGNGAGSNNSNGSNNTIVGSGSFLSGSNNTSVGNDTTTIGSNNTVIGFQSVINGGAVHSTVIGADAGTNKSNTVVLGSMTDTVEAPNLLTAKNITVSSKVVALTVDGGLGIFDMIKLNNTPLGDKQLCIKTTTKEIGVCPTSIINPADSQTDSFAKLVNQQSEKIEAQQKQLQQQQVLIENLRKLVCASNSTADVCQEVKLK